MVEEEANCQIDYVLVSRCSSSVGFISEPWRSHEDPPERTFAFRFILKPSLKTFFNECFNPILWIHMDELNDLAEIDS